MAITLDITNGRRMGSYDEASSVSDKDAVLVRLANGTGEKLVTVGALKAFSESDSVSFIRAMGGEASAPEKDYIVANGLNGVNIKPGAVFCIGEKVVVTEAAQVTVAGAAVGDDFQVYAYIENNAVKYAASKTPPSSPYRLIGGFHYGRVRNSKTPTDVAEGVVPNSVWTELHRPKCDPSGMAYCGNGMWADIYIMSGNPVSSKFGAAPRMSVTWYDAWNLLRAAGKRMPSYGEWCAIADGSPEGQDGNNTYARSATSNTSAGATGDVKLAVSSLNIVDCVGRVWEWVNDLCLDPTATSWAWQDIEANKGYGDMYIPSATALHALRCGGDWSNGVRGGARAVDAIIYPWDAYGRLSGRGVCDSL